MLWNSQHHLLWLVLICNSFRSISSSEIINTNTDDSKTINHKTTTQQPSFSPLTSQSNTKKVIPTNEIQQRSLRDVPLTTDVINHFDENEPTKEPVETSAIVSTTSLQLLSSKVMGQFTPSQSSLQQTSTDLFLTPTDEISSYFMSSTESISDIYDEGSLEVEVESTTESIIEEQTPTQSPILLNTNASIPAPPPIEPIVLNETSPNIMSPNESIDDFNEFQEENTDRFLSFEEWKKKKGVDSNNNQNELKPELIPNRDPKPYTKDSIGEEMEIDISNFFDTEKQDTQEEPEGKLYKDKFNFASFDCAATIVKTNSEAKSATSILFENKESYLLNPCSAPNKFVVIELCQDILVDSVVMGNFEFFSSTFKKIQISVSETFPVQPNSGWKILGQFDAKDIRDFQTFNIENPMIWAKYFRVEILEHYGSEFYCPLSVVRVHGRTMMQEYKQEEALQKSKIEEQSKKQEVHENVQPPQPVVNEFPEIDTTSHNDTAEECILTNQTVNRSIKNIQSNITNITQYELNYDCPVSLPQLRFDSLFENNQNKLKCDSTHSTNKTVVNSPTQTAQTIQQQTTGTQESIYKNIMKRLSLLESNATLSVLYIEEQSKLLSTAFSNLEKRQTLKFDKLIDTFNSSIYTQLENLSKLYQSFQTETDDLLTLQRLKHESMLQLANTKIDILSNDLKFQKILSFINILILIVVLVYVVLTRDTYIEDQQPSPALYSPRHHQQQDWVQLSKRRITSTGSRLKANLKKIYTSDGGYDSNKSIGPSDEEGDIYDGHTTPSSNEKDVIPMVNGKKKPLTPENSDDES